MPHPWDQKPASVAFDADYVVEWYVENDHERYKRLTIVGVPTREEVGRGGMIIHRPTHAVVCAVMEVPLPELDRVTSQLRTSERIRPQADYLVTLAEVADGTAQLRERLAAMELEVKRLREEVLDRAHTMDAYDKDIDRAETNLDELIWERTGGHTKLARPSRAQLGVRHTERAKKALGAISYCSGQELTRVRGALDERRSEVAADLLSKMGDGDW